MRSLRRDILGLLVPCVLILGVASALVPDPAEPLAQRRLNDEPSLGVGRVAVRAAAPLPETAYVRQRPLKDSLRNGGSDRFFDKDVDAFFINND
ncbi:hypothetical protein IscW_ISCW019617 [Ixodes scapularis]|uniref:Secreted protein n=1 Tax=Ixodes scapularis TaxID=6945 RepID=B7PWN5_IXOSC|nr:hypothetical protein IscW_ISCW019617 [Ixodes scapularis]|eukprot:XP_002410139.1 hypothetical protein IscW_ISCW019617 [Ixodes scapularis]